MDGNIGRVLRAAAQRTRLPQRFASERAGLRQALRSTSSARSLNVSSMACVSRAGRAVVLIVLLTGCGGGSRGVLSVPGDCTASEASLGFPAVAGFTASVHIKGQDCLDGSNYQTRSGTSVIIGNPFTRSFDGGLPGGPAATVWLYVSYEFDNGEILASSPDVNFSVPAAIQVTGRAFHLATFETSAPSWYTGFYGDPIVRGTTLIFAGDGEPTTIGAKNTYEYALYSTGV
ncbi:MAG: hypothetical protein QOF71_3455 [Candidatus Eremiobacteraeota bacterium]|nr:hypothetical protein [Candidatus Eremiobacteraeota bacterium]